MATGPSDKALATLLEAADQAITAEEWSTAMAKAKADGEAKPQPKAADTRDDAADLDLDSLLAPEESQAHNEPLFERIGGPVAIEAAVELFYEKVMADESLVGFFEGVDMRRQHKMLNDFMSMRR